LSLPTRASLAAAHAPVANANRLLAVLGLQWEDGLVGWGECSALNRATYSSESAADSFERLSDWVNGGPEPDATRLPMTAAAIEMAHLDAYLHHGGQSLAKFLGASTSKVKAGATIGLSSDEESLRETEELLALGFGRIKVKIQPGRAGGPRLLHEAFPELEIQVDGNASFGAEHLGELTELGSFVSAIEQPFPVNQPELAAELVEATAALVIADEAVGNIADAKVLLTVGALGAVAVKPPRLGGLGPAVEMLDWCARNQVGASVGGMLECGLGRRALAAIAAVDGFTVVGDLSPAGRWLSKDPWPDLTLADGWIEVPDRPGVAPPPDQEILDRFTIRLTERTA